MLTDSQTYQANFAELTTDFLNEIRVLIVADMSDQNRNATGRSAQSIRVDGTQLLGGSWIEWVFTGRGPGGFPPLSAIIDWLDAKGLPRGMAWNVAKKIAEQGTNLFRSGGKTSNILTEVLTPQNIDKFAKNIAQTIAVELSSEIKGIFA